MLLALAFAASAATYRWVDEQGVVHYSDKPQEGAVEVQLQGAQGYSAPAPADVKAKTTDGEAFRYDSVEIVSPYEEEVLFNIGTEMSLQVVTVPALRPEHLLKLTVDGKDVTGKAVRSKNFKVEGVFRGTHTAQVTVVDKDGNTVQQSGLRTFHVRQNIAKQPPRPQPRT
jgi:hypothetical protein